MDSRSKNSSRNIISGLSNSFFTILFGFLVRTAIIKYLNDQYLGLTSVFGSIISVLSLSELGISTAIVVNLYKPIYENNIEEVRAILTFYRNTYRFIGVTIGIIGVCIVPFIGFLVKDTSKIDCNIYITYLLYLLNTVLSYFLFTYKEALLNSLQRFDIVKTIYTIVYIIKNLTQIFILIAFGDFYLFALSQIFFTILNNIFIQIASKKKYPQYFCKGKLDKDKKIEIRKNIVGVAIVKILDVARNSIDSLVISTFLGLGIVAIYNNYFYIYNALVGIVWIIVNAIQASVGNNIVSENLKKNYSDYLKFELILSMFISAVTIYLVSLYQPFMEMWMGNGLMLSDLDMLLFVVYFYCMAMNGMRNAYFNGVGLWWKGRKIAILESISNLALNIVLCKLFGVTGILIATIMTMVLINYICNTNLLFKEYFHMSAKKFYIDRICFSLITIILCLMSWEINHLIRGSNFQLFTLRIIITTCIVVMLVPTLYYCVRKERVIEAVNYMRAVLGRYYK